MEEKSWLDLREGEFKIPGFRFASGETLDDLTIRYMTLGARQRDPDGNITNAVLLIHNTIGSGRTWLQPSLAGELFGEGQALDLLENSIVIPDMVGFGGSSKPSDSMRARFPHYRYDDMVVSTHRLLTECLGIGRLKLLLGISMGGMLAWIYGAKYPGFVERLVPVASQPGPMSGRNRIQRRVSIEAIRIDPDRNNGDYETNPTRRHAAVPISAVLMYVNERNDTGTEADAVLAFQIRTGRVVVGRSGEKGRRTLGRRAQLPGQ